MNKEWRYTKEDLFEIMVRTRALLVKMQDGGLPAHDERSVEITEILEITKGYLQPRCYLITSPGYWYLKSDKTWTMDAMQAMQFKTMREVKVYIKECGGFPNYGLAYIQGPSGGWYSKRGAKYVP